MPRSALISVALGLALAGCGGDQNWSMDPNWQGDAKAKQPGAFETEANVLTPASRASGNDTQTWFAVRHDLTMSPSAPRTAACGCLAVEVGMPGKQAFLWDGGQAPAIGGDAVVVALSARGVSCPAEPDESKRRSSISAVDRDGDDVVIEIEELPEGRPLALGAIIPKPGPNGALYLQPRDKKVRFSGASDTSRRCKVKSPTTTAPAATTGDVDSDVNVAP